jgi:demethylmenaquinone methyltransferase/2-methoxy-6-polyprenyl-1,4-benzoquinol methylase
MLKKNQSKKKNPTTNFGFKKVGILEKPKLVRDVFDSVAPNYDLMNDLMSLGIHRIWKHALIKKVKLGSTTRVLDVGGGTGDIAFKLFDKKFKNIVITDVNNEMLEVGRNRAFDRGIIKAFSWVGGDAEILPFENSSFDVYTTAFCMRNVTDLNQALREANRILKPGGQFLCLEFSHMILPSLAKIYDAYSLNLLPIMGQIFANDKASYQYLAESIRRFPRQEEFLTLIKDAGLENISYQNLSGGIVAIHSAWKL